jgi:oxygen-dependent protoporphyrinogen oxidase
MIDCDVLVVGAGISGLTVAFELAQAKRDVIVVEAGERAGGVIGTCTRDGALYELGPNSTLDTTPVIDDLLRRAGILEQRVNASALASRRFIVRNGRPVPLPTSPGAFLTTDAFTFGAKLRLLREPFTAPASPEREESIAQFVQRRLGREFLDYAIDPFVAGIYAGDPHEISVQAAFPRLHALEQKYGSLIKGQIGGARERRKSGEQAKNTARSFSFARGMQTLPDALARALPPIVYRTQIATLQRDGTMWRAAGTSAGAPFEVRARNVVLALPAHAAAGLVASFAPAAASVLRAIEYAPIAGVASLYRREDVQHPLDGFGFLVPRIEQRRILGSLFSSSMFPGRAPEGSVLLTTFAGGKRHPEIADWSDAQVAETVRSELGALAGAGTPQWEAVTRWARAIPQYTLGHLARIAVVEACESAHPGLRFCASYRGGVAVGDCIKSATTLAQHLRPT